MKLEILIRVEEMSSGDEIDDGGPDSDIDVDAQVIVTVPKVMDGEQSSAEEDPQKQADNETPPINSKDVETILELAYLRDQNIFSRDANTRRSKGREDLRKATRA